MFDEEISVYADELVKAFSRQGKTVTTAESCTGGMIGAALTSVAGSSDVYKSGLITYSNEAKITYLNVEPDTLSEHGAVSSQTAAQMAIGALEAAKADAAVAVTGIAGPGGGSEEKPVGLVFISVASADEEGAYVERLEFGDIGRQQVRLETTRQALEMLLAYGLETDA
ncbi:MAG: CinA family protein [Pseudomonadota bacterium]